MPQESSYSHFTSFIQKYLSRGFRKIENEPSFMAGMDRILDQNMQFFYVADLTRLKILFTSSQSRKIIGVEPEEVDPATFLRIIHPNDQVRHNLARTKLIKMGYDMFLKKEGEGFISASFRTKSLSGDYIDLLYQGRLFYSPPPHHTVLLIMVFTDISGMGWRKLGYHYYVGTDPAFFRYPDAELIRVGRLFSNREMEILRYLGKGMNSEEIARSLFLSINTINTHRRNILRKSGKATTHDLIMDMKEMGML